MHEALIVEDDPEAAAYLVKAFREAGHVADQRPDGERAMRWRASGDYDVARSSTACCRSCDGLSLIHGLREQKATRRRC